MSSVDARAQTKALKKSRSSYKEGVYVDRPRLKSFKSKKSGHLGRVLDHYGRDVGELIRDGVPSCSDELAAAVMSKGAGAYYSGGSRPNQTQHSWKVARLASALTGGPASLVDRKEIEAHCSKSSKAYKLMKRRERKSKRSDGQRT